jgi:hypothetical protein
VIGSAGSPLEAGLEPSFRTCSHSQYGDIRAHMLWSRVNSQVVENYRRKSVEGLALPFLANWLFGASFFP